MIAPSPQKLHNIQALRGIAALLVVFTHLPSMEIKHGGDSILPAITRFGISGVDLFFVISGFVMVYVTWSSQRSRGDSLKFLFSRFTRIYPIYWLIALSVFLAWLIKPDLISFESQRTSLLRSFFLWPDSTLPMLKVAWTLIHELYFYLIFALILLLPKRHLLTGLFVWIGLVIVGNQLGLSKISPEMALIFHPLGIEFFMGAIAGWVFKAFCGAAGKLSLIAGIVLAVVSIYLLATDFPDSFYPGHWARVLYFGLPGVLIVYGMAASEKSGWKLPQWSSTFGDWSYSLYLSHILTLSILGYFWRPFASEGPIDNLIAIFIFVIGSIIVSALLWYVFERPLLNFFRRRRSQLFPNG